MPTATTRPVYQDAIIRGESEQLWHPCPPHCIVPFRCTQRHSEVGRCRRGRRHKGDHWARDLFWEQR